MRKSLSMIMAGALCLSATLFSGCGGTETKRDDSKTQLDISYFAGGFGTAWIEQAATEFAQKYEKYSFEAGKEGVQIWRDDNKTMMSTINANMQAGTNLRDLYFTTGGNVQSLIAKDLLEPINDVYQAKPDGENGKTIEAKVLDVRNVEKVYGDGTNVYSLPYTQAITGLVFDYQLFVEKEWLAFADSTDVADLQAQGFTYTETTNKYGTPVLVMESYTGTERITYKKGDVILKAGKDGKFGSHDDGQPQNIEEWNTMIQLISSAERTKAFIYTNKQADYLDPIAEAIFAQYDGIENYEITYDYDGTYVSPSTGEETPITLENGYKVWEFEGRKVALEFMKDYLANKTNLHPAISNDRTAMEVQEEYVLGYKGTALNPQAGMIVEGTWWENEVRGLCNELAAAGEKDRGYGARDYRYMLYPAFENQKGIDGNGNGTVFSSFEDGCILVRKGAKAGSKAAAKKFIEFITSDDWLSRFTTMTGGVRPFDYSLTNAQFDGLTSFQQHVWNIYHDSENYKVVTPNQMLYSQPINYDSSVTVNRFESKVSSVSYINAITGLLNSKVTAEQYFEGSKGIYSESAWSSMLQTIK